MRERDLDRMFVAACKRRGIVTYKVSSWANRGVSDRLLLGPGDRLAFVELKGVNGKVTHHQQTFLETARRAGVQAHVLFAHPAGPNHTRVLVDDFLDVYLT